MADVPAALPPPGVVSHIGGGPALGPAVAAVAAVLVPTSFAALVCRLVANRRIRGSILKLHPADWTAIAAFVFAIVTTALDLSLWEYQRHQWDQSLAVLFNNSGLVKKIFTLALFIWAALLLSKISILLLYLQIFGRARWLRNGVFVGIVWAFIAYLPNYITTPYFCAPHIGEHWDITIDLRCGEDPTHKMWLVVNQAIALGLDIYVTILPVPIIVGLNLNSKKKLGVLFVFLTASLVSICALLSLIYRIKLLATSDNSWVASQLWITVIVEVFIAIIVGCVPGVKSFWKNCLISSPVYRSFVSRSHGSTTSSVKVTPAYPYSQISNLQSLPENKLNGESMIGLEDRTKHSSYVTETRLV